MFETCSLDNLQHAQGLAPGETIAVLPNQQSDAGVTSAALVDTQAFIEAGELAQVLDLCLAMKLS
eukprot:2597360-Amphidinium_carterae.1